MITVVLNPNTESFIREIFDIYPQVDPHEFATAYVNYVEATGRKPGIWAAMDQFALEGVIA